MKKFLLNYVYLLLGLPLGVVYFTILATGLSLGVGLLITLIGIPILAGMIFMAYALADFERFVISKMLGMEITKPEARPAESNATLAILAVQLRDWSFWKQFVYLVLKMPLGLFTFTVAIVLSVSSVAMIAAPALVTLFPGSVSVRFGIAQVDPFGEAWIACVAGLALGLISVWVINRLAALSVWFARQTIGR